MKRRFGLLVLVLLALAALAAALRHDLANLAIRQGAGRLSDGDWAGAQAAFARAIALGRDSALLRYDLGVSLYRGGEFDQARQQFEAALVSAPPDMVVAVRFNRGNSYYRLAERRAGGDREAAEKFLRAAIADYGEALVHDPAAADARGNLDLSRSRLAALTAAAGGDQARQSRRPGAERQAGAAASGPETAAGRQQAVPGQPAAADGSAGRADSPVPPGSTGKARRDISRTEAERLLNDARGREQLAGSLHGGRPHGQVAQPEKDW